MPAGQTIRKLGAVVSVTVTLRSTALTPLDGTPPCPRTWTFRVAPGPSGPPPRRVSRIRAGTSARYAPRPATTAFEAAEAGPGPEPLLAVTVDVYDVPSLRPPTTAERVLPPTVAFAPPGDAVTA